MARPKKTTTRKTTTKKATTRGRPKAKTTRTKQTKGTQRASKQPKTKEQMSAHLKSQTAEIKLLKGKDVTRRPPNNPDMPNNIISMLNNDLNSIKELLDSFSQHLRALDRRRLNGVGIKKMGFIDRAYELALENGEFLPHYLTLERFGADIQYFMDFRSLTDLCAQIREQLWNITIQSSDIAYTDALEFYASVREAAKRRVDAAESLFAALSPFFKSHGKKMENSETAPTKKEELRNAKGLIKGTHDGILVIENKKPKLTGGKHKVIDETFRDSAEYQDTEEGKITE